MLALRYKVRPHAGSANEPLFSHGYANVLVDSDDPLFAKTRAKGYLLGQGWDVVASEGDEAAIADERFSDWDKERQRAYLTAKASGVACLLDAVPIVKNPP